MKRLFLLLVLIATSCVYATSFNLGRYLEEPPVVRPLPDREDLVEEYGPGHVWIEPNPEGAPFLEHHSYFDRSNRLWVVASVMVAGPESNLLVGVLVTDIAIGPMEDELATPLNVHSVRGIKLGDSTGHLTKRLGPPLRTTKTNLGTHSGIDMYEYFPEDTNPVFSLRYYTRDEVVVGMAVFFTE